MFWKKEKTAEIVRTATTHSNPSGSSKRVKDLIPIAPPGAHEITKTNNVKFHHLLVTLEGNQRSGCLKIISPKMKSRSAILLYKGRVVGCVYGKKNLDYQYLQQHAHQYALNDLANPGNILDAYQLPEDLVLAAASLFYGNVLDGQQSSNSEEVFQQTVKQIIEMELPGCVIVNNDEGEMLCMVYLHAGRIIRVFSAKDGWVDPLYENAVKYVLSTTKVQVLGSILPIKAEDIEIGFSLTGLGDCSKKQLLGPQLKAVDSFTFGSQTYSNMPQQPSIQNLRNKQSTQLDSRLGIFAIAP